MRILFVENDVVFARVVTGEFLTAHDVVVVCTVGEACERAANEAFDVALVDYDLDDGKGTAVVEALRRMGFTGRIVAVSSHQAGNDALVRAGADDSCSKMAFAEIDQYLR